MKTIFMNVINGGNYDLSSLLAKVDKYHIEGKLTDADREEVYAAARKEPTAQYDFAVEIEKLWTEIRAIWDKVSGEEAETEAQEYKQPTGAHDAYNTGDKVVYNGVVYSCLMDNCVWSPETLPSAWMVNA